MMEKSKTITYKKEGGGISVIVVNHFPGQKKKKKYSLRSLLVSKRGFKGNPKMSILRPLLCMVHSAGTVAILSTRSYYVLSLAFRYPLTDRVA